MRAQSGKYDYAQISVEITGAVASGLAIRGAEAQLETAHFNFNRSADSYEPRSLNRHLKPGIIK
jgi:hypothetical protein